jgi:carbon starvation protein
MNVPVKLLWVGIAILGAIALAIVPLSRGETINSVWLVAAAVCTHLIAYCSYGLFIGRSVMQLDAKRATPAYRHNDGLDYVPTHRYVLFGHQRGQLGRDAVRSKLGPRTLLACGRLKAPP